ncbi:hypothetical protein [Agromyces italicus]|uniref:hypothetical protein n=1 Tax=Agromyces italicus TaxID=279572 RepID=UPI0003B475E8|nr:hypothetical protein [Agromyces italicus]
MTLTRLLPTLRRSIPDPIAPERWPAGTRATTTDIIVGGLSMTRLAERDGTPLTHLAPTPAGALGERVRHRGVALATVRDVSVGPGLEVAVDAERGPHRPDWAEARLIGRVSVAKVVAVSIRFADGGCHGLARLELPGDLAVGDLVAVPIEADRVMISVAPPSPPAPDPDPAPDPAGLQDNSGFTGRSRAQVSCESPVVL